jgi:hypothetical protein
MRQKLFPILISLILITFCSKGQEEVTFFEGDYKPLLIFVYPESHSEEVLVKLKNSKRFSTKKCDFMLICDSLANSSSVVNRINKYLNSEKLIDKQRVYYLEWGIETISKYVQNTPNDIFANYEYYQIKENNSKFDMDELIDRFKNSYISDLTLIELEKSTNINIASTKKLSFGTSLSYNSQNVFVEDSAYLPNSIKRFGINIGYRLNPRLYLIGKTSFSAKIPNQEKLQSDIFSNINIFAGGTQIINIDVKAHIVLQGSIEANYFLIDKYKLRPFVGAGLSFVSFRSARIREQVELDLSNLGAGGGLPTGGLQSALGGSAGNLPFFMGKNVAPFAKLGLNYKMTRNINLLCSGQYDHSNKNQVNGVSINAKSMGFSMDIGIQIELNKGKKKYFEYLKTNSTR